jgi:SpoVK/Ycf46/Vps4 family AAA+-type ATPase
MPRGRRSRNRNIGNSMGNSYMDNYSSDGDFDIDNSKLNEIDQDEPPEEFEEDIHDSDQKKLNGNKNSNKSHKSDSHIDGGDEDDEDDNDEDDGDGIRSHRTRSRKQINYNEDAYLNDLDDVDDIDDSTSNVNTNTNGNGNEDEDEYEPNNKRRRMQNHKFKEEDDDFNIDENEDFDELNAKDDDDFLASDDDLTHSQKRRKRSTNFVVNDDYYDNADDDEYGIKKNMRRSTRSTRSSRSHRSRNGRSNRWTQLLDNNNNDNDNNNNDHTVTLEDELKDLQKDSPLNSPKRNLRHRKDVNYTLPPPYLSEAQLEELGNANQSESNYSPRKGRGIGRYGGATSSNTTIRRLFPTVGPFGGSEVQSLFQSNSIPSGLAALANAESSDSDDENDLIKPTDPNDTSTNIIATNDSINKKKNTLADTDPLGIDTNIDFSVVGGLNNYINQLKEMITLPLLYPEVYSKFHITPPRGVLFHGPPGTGKTLMARALAASCSSQNKKITFFMRKGADCLSKWVGEAERHLRLLFEEAKQHQPSIIFFDEIDGLAPVRSSKQEQIHASIVSTLLALMDGMDNRGQVIIIGATNRPDSIDPALRRPGRFDREFYFPLPDIKAREEILRIHMRKWDNQLDDKFIKELAILTKGYGGADLRALCTESALNSIQRQYPQIYKSNDKLKIDISKIKANSSDFSRALKKIVPNSARSTTSISEPLPEFIKPLLENQFNEILEKLNQTLPMEKEVSLLEEAEYETLNNDFQIQELVKTYDSMRTFKPRIAISGSKLQGLKYISNAILNKLEGFSIQTLDLGKIFGDSSISIENLSIQLFSELKRHKPSILFIPDTIGFLNTVSESLKSTIRYLVRGINNNDKILIYCELEGELNDDLLYELEDLFDLNTSNIISVRDSTEEERSCFFHKFWKSIDITPSEYNDITIRPKRKQEKLEVVEVSKTEDELKKGQSKLAKSTKELAKNDMRLKNSLKVKLSTLLDIFKVRYKRFKKPIIDDSYLIHLFDEISDPNSNYQIKDDKILEISTNKLYTNIDLEVIEERLWNGYYSEPRQFLRDLELILKDANVFGERERILKANEMYAHAVVGVEEIEVQFPLLVQQWKEVSVREKQRKLEYMALQKEREKESEKEKTKENQTDNEEEKEEEKDEEKEEENENDENDAGFINPETTLISETVVNGSENIEDNEEREVLKDIEQGDNSENAVTDEIPIDEQIQAQSQLLPEQREINGNANFQVELEVKPVELSEPVEKVEVENQVASEKLANGIQTNEEEPTQSKVNEDEFIPEEQTVYYDGSELDLLQALLLEKTKAFKLTKLERINSKLCSIVWNHRLSLDKTELLAELKEYIQELQ